MTKLPKKISKWNLRQLPLNLWLNSSLSACWTSIARNKIAKKEENLTVFLTGQYPKTLNCQESVFPAHQKTPEKTTIFLKVKNAGQKPVKIVQLEQAIQNLLASKSQSYNLSEEQQQIVFQRLQSITESSTVNKENLTFKPSTMESMAMDSQSMSIDFDQFLDDLCNNVQSEDNTLLDQVLEELSDSCMESSPEPNEVSGDLNLSDLSELPLEDFANLESMLSDIYSDEVATSIDNMCHENTISPSEVLNFSDIFEEFNSQSSPMDQLGDFSEQSSPMNETGELEFNSLLNSAFDSDFMQEFIDLENENNQVSDANVLTDISFILNDFQPDTQFLGHLNVNNDEASSFSNNVSIINDSSISIINDSSITPSGAKRKISESDNEVEASVNKDIKIIPMKIRDNETEKEAIRRIKNNEASKITRAKRRRKSENLLKQQTELEKNNAQLRIKIEVMQKEAEILRQVLVSKLSNNRN